MLKRSQTEAVGSPSPYDAAALPVADSSTHVQATAQSPRPRLQALKDELFELESDRIAGRVTAAEYAEQKAALDVVLRRALSRIEPGSTASNS